MAPKIFYHSFVDSLVLEVLTNRNAYVDQRIMNKKRIVNKQTTSRLNRLNVNSPGHVISVGQTEVAQNWQPQNSVV